ncbi:palmitoyltransferase ZDHHC19-like isoform X2 [Marmota marmota marmota]|uniref:palmitoyltransferase ZDHHC19-like isoform X2 n=1 Tax=Marmota marmota marmota TaxID=9994 RepID=UPI0020922049|nr:palmitoyltransferase ZDHHC19-like isoform X2 [Marmota marmota marmota]
MKAHFFKKMRGGEVKWEWGDNTVFGAVEQHKEDPKKYLEGRVRGKGQFLQGDNFFYQGCASNWYMTICAPLGSKYLSEAVWLQREEVTEWDSLHALCLPRYSSPHHPTEFPGPTSQTLGFYTHGQGPPGSGKAAAFQELPISPMLQWEAPRGGLASPSPLHTQRSKDVHLNFIS